MNKTNVPKGRSGELVPWVLATAIIMPLAWIVVFVSIFMLDAFVHPLWQFAVSQAFLFVVCGIVAGCIVGAGQWLALLGNVGWANDWFRATVASWALISIVWWLEYRLFGGPSFEISQQAVIPTVLFTSLVSGVILGTAQWRMLRQKVEISPFWILTTAASWFIAAGATIITIAFVVTKPDPVGSTYFPILLMPGAIVGLGTGLARPKLVGSLKGNLPDVEHPI